MRTRSVSAGWAVCSLLILSALGSPVAAATLQITAPANDATVTCQQTVTVVLQLGDNEVYVGPFYIHLVDTC